MADSLLYDRFMSETVTPTEAFVVRRASDKRYLTENNGFSPCREKAVAFETFEQARDAKVNSGSFSTMYVERERAS